MIASGLALVKPSSYARAGRPTIAVQVHAVKPPRRMERYGPPLGPRLGRGLLPISSRTATPLELSEGHPILALPRGDRLRSRGDRRAG